MGIPQWEQMYKHGIGCSPLMIPTQERAGTPQVNSQLVLHGSVDRRRLVPEHLGPIGSYSRVLREQFVWRRYESYSPEYTQSPLDLRQRRLMSLRTTQPSVELGSSSAVSLSNVTPRQTGLRQRNVPSPEDWTTARQMYTSSIIGR